MTEVIVGEWYFDSVRNVCGTGSLTRSCGLKGRSLSSPKTQRTGISPFQTHRYSADVLTKPARTGF